MKNNLIKYILLMFLSVFISSVSQVLLKKSAQKEYDSGLKEYLNPLVITAYLLFFLTTVVTVYAYKKVPLSFGAVIEASGYIYVMFWGVVVFKEKINSRKIIALGLIVSGILVYSLS